jgi:alkylation response protein AidB-like acyl-CoA dehydrogenase
MSLDSELRDSVQQALRDAGLAAEEDKTWPLVVDLGWLLVAVPEDLDGMGQGLSEACIFYRELGAGLAAAPYLSAMLAVEAVCRSSLPNRADWLRRLAGGEYAAASLYEACDVTVQTSSANLMLSGSISAVPSADKAGHILVTAANPDYVVLVPKGRPGIEIVSRPTWDVTRRLFDVRLADAEIPPELILAHGAAAGALARTLAIHRDFALAADSVGGAAALLEITVEYLKTRRQFARPIAMFQALKHRCADLKALTAAAEALLLDNLNKAKANDDAEAEVLGKEAKSLACSVYSRVAEEALQLHGGIGVTSEHICHRFLKRALLNAQLGRPHASYDLDIAAATLCGV